MDKELQSIYSQLITQKEPAPSTAGEFEDEPASLETSQQEAAPEPSIENESTNGDVSSDSSEEPTKLGEESEEGLSWDSFVEDVPASEAAAPTPDFTSIGKAIEADVKSQDELVSYVKSLKEQLSQAKAASYKDDPSLPDEVKEVIEVAKAGGDYFAILDVFSVDYSQEDPVKLFEDEVAEYFYNEDGSFRQDEYEEYLDSLLPADKVMRGKAIQRELIQLQEQKRFEIKQKAAEEKARQIEAVKRTLDQLDKVNDFQVTQKIKKQMFDDFVSGAVYAQIGILPNGKIDPSKAVINYFKARYFDAVQQFLTQKVRNDKTRETVRELANQKIERAPQIENVTPSKKSDPVGDYLSQLEKFGVTR